MGLYQFEQQKVLHIKYDEVLKHIAYMCETAEVDVPTPFPLRDSRICFYELITFLFNVRTNSFF